MAMQYAQKGRIARRGVAEAALYCAHRTSTFLWCAFCEQEGHLAAPFPAGGLFSILLEIVARIPVRLPTLFHQDQLFQLSR